jgi:alpha-L-fucosidase 2
MVFGGVDVERLQVAEKSLWTGGPGAEGGCDYGLPTESQAALMGSISKKLLDGATLTPEDLAKQLGRKMHNYGDYQSFGDLIIENAGGEGEVSDYRRELDLEAGVARVKFKQGMVGFRREYFVSYPDQVVVGRWYSTATQNLRVRFAVPDNRSAQTRLEASAKGGRLSVSGALKSNGLRYTAELLVIPECGTVTADGEALRVEGDCAVTFILSARTNYQMRYPEYRDPRAVARSAKAKRTVLPAAGATPC